MTLHRLLIATVAVATLHGSTSHAQSKYSFAVDASANPSEAKGGEYKNDFVTSVRGAASLTRTMNARISMFAEVAVDPASATNTDKDCIPSSRGGCAPPYPAFTSASALLGVVSGRERSWFEVRAGVGGGVVSHDGTQVGAVVSQADLGLFPVRHLGLVLGWRATIIPRFQGDRLTIRSALVGLRLR